MRIEKIPQSEKDNFVEKLLYVLKIHEDRIFNLTKQDDIRFELHFENIKLEIAINLSEHIRISIETQGVDDYFYYRNSDKHYGEIMDFFIEKCPDIRDSFNICEYFLNTVDNFKRVKNIETIEE